MRLLITGGLGFIGSHFIRHILKKYPDYQVVNLDKITYCGNPANLKDVENDPRYHFIKGDICDEKLVDDIVSEKPDAILHFAAESHVDRSILSPHEFLRTNVLGTQVLLETARRHNIKRFIHIGTDEEYGSKDQGYFRESDVLNPASPYSASKAGASLLAISYFKTYNFPVIITRSTNNYGPFQYPEKIIPLFITNLFEDKKVPLYGDGLNVRDWLYVLDNCEAIDSVLHQGREGEIYNVAGLEELSNLDLTKAVLLALGKDESYIEYVKDRPGHDRRYALDCAKIKNELGWQPKYKFSEALAQTIDWYRNNKDWWGPIKSGEYMEYYKKQYGILA